MDVLRAIPQVAFGNPGRYFQELRHGKTLSPGRLFRQSLDPRITGFKPLTNKALTALNAAAMYGVPAYETYKAYQRPESDRGSAVGSVLGVTLGSTLAAPLGLVGNIAGSTLGSALGGTVGSAFDARPSGSPQPYAYR